MYYDFEKRKEYAVRILKLIQNRVKGESRKVFKQVLKKWDIREGDLTGGDYQ